MKTLHSLLTRRNLLLSLLLGTLLTLSGCVGVDAGYGSGYYSTGYRGGYSPYGEGYYGGRYVTRGQYVGRDGRTYSRPVRTYTGRSSYRQGRRYRSERPSYSYRRNGEVRSSGETRRGRGSDRRYQRQVP